MNEWDIAAFDQKDKIGGIETPTVRITLAHRQTKQEILVVLQRQSHRVYKNLGDKTGRIVMDKEYTLVAGWSAKSNYAMGDELVRNEGVDLDLLLTMANLTLEIG